MVVGRYIQQTLASKHWDVLEGRLNANTHLHWFKGVAVGSGAAGGSEF